MGEITPDDFGAVARIFLVFGPYAILAAFALWVAPRETKRFLDLPGDASGTTKTISGCAAIAQDIL